MASSSSPDSAWITRPETPDNSLNKDLVKANKRIKGRKKVIQRSSSVPGTPQSVRSLSLSLGNLPSQQSTGAPPGGAMNMVPTNHSGTTGREMHPSIPHQHQRQASTQSMHSVQSLANIQGPPPGSSVMFIDSQGICALCKKPYDEPRLLKCGHCYCSGCILKNMKSRTLRKYAIIKCPNRKCHRETKIPGGKIEKLQQLQAFSDMRQGHSDRRHTTEQKPVDFCRQHPRSFLRFYCLMCDMPICPDCIDSSHDGHNICSLEKAAKESQNTLQIMTKGLGENIASVQQKLNKLSQFRWKLHNNFATVEGDIRERANAILLYMNNHCDRLLQNLSDVWQDKMAELDVAIAEADDALRVLNAMKINAASVINGRHADIVHETFLIQQELPRIVSIAHAPLPQKISLSFDKGVLPYDDLSNIFGSFSVDSEEWKNGILKNNNTSLNSSSSSQQTSVVLPSSTSASSQLEGDRAQNMEEVHYKRPEVVPISLYHPTGGQKTPTSASPPTSASHVHDQMQIATEAQQQMEMLRLQNNRMNMKAAAQHIHVQNGAKSHYQTPQAVPKAQLPQSLQLSQTAVQPNAKSTNIIRLKANAKEKIYSVPIITPKTTKETKTGNYATVYAFRTASTANQSTMSTVRDPTMSTVREHTPQQHNSMRHSGNVNSYDPAAADGSMSMPPGGSGRSTVSSSFRVQDDPPYHRPKNISIISIGHNVHDGGNHVIDSDNQSPRYAHPHVKAYQQPFIKVQPTIYEDSGGSGSSMPTTRDQTKQSLGNSGLKVNKSIGQQQEEGHIYQHSQHTWAQPVSNPILSHAISQHGSHHPVSYAEPHHESYHPATQVQQGQQTSNVTHVHPFQHQHNHRVQHHNINQLSTKLEHSPTNSSPHQDHQMNVGDTSWVQDSYQYLQEVQTPPSETPSQQKLSPRDYYQEGITYL